MSILVLNKSVVEEVPRPVVSATITEKTDKEYISACHKSRECSLLLQAAYYESRGESDRGVAAVMYVILNRVEHKSWANTVEGVLSAPSQFSYRFDGSMRKGYAEKKQRDRIAVIAMKVVEGKIKDPTRGADMYHAVYANPKWDWSKLESRGKIGKHVFYKHI